jgi:polyhydroxybutyrate depolymerase
MTILILTLLLAPTAEPERREWTIDGTQREALIYRPSQPAAAESGAAPKPVPVVFGFHGHGGNARQAARSFHLQDEWPEAIVVYMQGVPTPGRLTDPEGKQNGWQHDPGDHEDRDLKFFDAVLASLKKDYQIDENRVYVTGHSNGAAFTYVLWVARGEVLAAIAPSAGFSRSARTAKPKPVLHIAGETDPLVRFPVQRMAMNAVRSINGCEATGKEWAKNCLEYPSSKGTPFVSFIHPGDHKYPEEAPALIVKFFKEHTRPEMGEIKPSRP